MVRRPANQQAGHEALGDGLHHRPREHVDTQLGPPTNAATTPLVSLASGEAQQHCLVAEPVFKHKNTKTQRVGPSHPETQLHS